MNIIYTHALVLILTLIPAHLLGSSPSSQPQAQTEQQSEWVSEVRMGQKYGMWEAQDKKNKTVIIEGEMISPQGKILSSENDIPKLGALLAEVMQEPVASLATLWYPEIIVLRTFRTLLTGKNQTDFIYEAYTEHLKEAMSPQAPGVTYIFTISEPQPDRTLKLLGSVMFTVRNDYRHGTIEGNSLVISPTARSRNLATLLSSTIFKLVPQIKRIILDVLRTNIGVMKAYESIGFTRYPRDNENCVLRALHNRYEYAYEYLTDSPRCQRLQATALTLKEITASSTAEPA